MIKDHGHVVLGSYTIEQVYQGESVDDGMVTETSKLDSDEGIRFRGYSIPELRGASERGSVARICRRGFLFTAYR